MRATRKLIALLVAAALVAAGCGGDDDDDDAETASGRRRGRGRDRLRGHRRHHPHRPAGRPVGPVRGAGRRHRHRPAGLLRPGQQDGGIAGREVELEVVDTRYDVPTHQQFFQEMSAEDDSGVVMISQSTGSPHTANIAQSLVDADLIAIPLTWYSGWADPTIGQNVLETYTNYCLEAMNAFQFMADEGAETVAIVSFPGEYGQDGATGRQDGGRGARARGGLRRRGRGHPADAHQPDPRQLGRGPGHRRRQPRLGVDHGQPVDPGHADGPDRRPTASRASGRATRRPTTTSCSPRRSRSSSTRRTGCRPTR